jgi:hypothetical protein
MMFAFRRQLESAIRRRLPGDRVRIIPAQGETFGPSDAYAAGWLMYHLVSVVIPAEQQEERRCAREHTRKTRRAEASMNQARERRKKIKRRQQKKLRVLAKQYPWLLEIPPVSRWLDDRSTRGSAAQI